MNTTQQARQLLNAAIDELDLWPDTVHRIERMALACTAADSITSVEIRHMLEAIQLVTRGAHAIMDENRAYGPRLAAIIDEYQCPRCDDE